METKLYQVKEIMEMFGITRDTIKYYEKRGLLRPAREENGYRLFDAFNVEKLKKALDLRNLGFSIEEIIEINNSNDWKKNLAMIAHLRQETEQKMKELIKNLEKIRIYESCFLETQRFVGGFNVEYDVVFCTYCPKLTDQDKKTFFVKQAKIIHLNEQFVPERTENKYIIRGNPKLKEECRTCKREKIHFDAAFRGLIQDEGSEKLFQILKEVFQDASLMGYELMRKVYIMKKVLKENDIEKVFLDIRIPIKE